MIYGSLNTQDDDYVESSTSIEKNVINYKERALKNFKDLRTLSDRCNKGTITISKKLDDDNKVSSVRRKKETYAFCYGNF